MSQESLDSLLDPTSLIRVGFPVPQRVPLSCFSESFSLCVGATGLTKRQTPGASCRSQPGSCVVLPPQILNVLPAVARDRWDSNCQSGEIIVKRGGEEKGIRGWASEPDYTFIKNELMIKVICCALSGTIKLNYPWTHTEPVNGLQKVGNSRIPWRFFLV